VRVDAGVDVGSVVGGAFDSLLAKIIVTGATREQALQRARRVLDETDVAGLATVLPFHRLVVRDPAFVDFSVHTRWIETEWTGTVAPFDAAHSVEQPPERTTVVVEVDGRRLEVRLPAGLAGAPAAAPARGPGRRPRGGTTPSPGGAALPAPMQGTVVKVAVADGDAVTEGDLIVVIEAMKMEQPVHAHRTGTVSGLSVEIGTVVPQSTTICTIA
jgi:acetyl-CoA/propionyl-CoA carboxylase biotin carboxyl carrier protein